jgi:hypothetical protein
VDALRRPIWNSMQTELLTRLRTPLGSAAAAILLAWCVGMFGREKQTSLGG